MYYILSIIKNLLLPEIFRFEKTICKLDISIILNLSRLTFNRIKD